LGAYQRELCNNFKDKGVSNFGGTLFGAIRDEVSDIFDGMPPPKRDVVSTRSTRGATRGGGGGVTRGGGGYRGSNVSVGSPDSAPDNSAPDSGPISMQSYNSQVGPCCASGSLVWVKDKMDDVLKKPVEELVKGDQVYTVSTDGDHLYSEIECIVRTECPDKKASLVQVRDLRVTPYHPIMKGSSEWVFPCTLGETVVQECEALYSFIVRNRKPMIVDGQVFATWGHGLQGPVIGHEYFGTDRIIEDMKRFTTYGLGIVNLVPQMIKRDPTSQLICEICE